jgi:hypothetical protein
MIQNRDHMYHGEEAQVAQTLAKWARERVPASARQGAAR